MSVDLTLEEQKHVRTALRYLRLKIGTWKPLALALHFDSETIGKVVSGRRAVTPRMAMRVARFVDVPVDDLIAGKYLPPQTCPHCGHLPDFVDEKTIAE